MPVAASLRLDPEVPFESWLGEQSPAYGDLGLNLWSQSPARSRVVTKENCRQTENRLSGVWQRLVRQAL